MRRVTRTSTSRSPVKAVRIESEDSDDLDDDDIIMVDASASATGSPSKIRSRRKGKAKLEDNEPLIYNNAHTAYFANTARATQTSTNVFSSLLVPLSLEEYAAALAVPNATAKHHTERRALADSHRGFFPQYLSELMLGFNILFYGLGSKRSIVNEFASEHCAMYGDVVVVNGFIPQCNIKDVLASIERVPGLTDKPYSGGLDGQVNRIYEWYAHQSTQRRPLFLVVHNIDAPALLAPKARSIFSMLALNPDIHIIGTMDRVGTTPIWTTSESASRKHPRPPSPLDAPSADDGGAVEDWDIPGSRGFAWLWHDLTTMEAYKAELTFTDPTSINGALGEVAVAGGANGALSGGPMTESAAQHILAAVTLKAKKLFLLLAKKQLESTQEGTVTAENMLQYAISRDVLFRFAVEDFIATNETGMSALLGEFRDHGLIRSHSEGAGAGETLWIPLRKELLMKIIDSIEL